MIKDDQRIVVGNWFGQYFSIKLKNDAEHDIHPKRTYPTVESQSLRLVLSAVFSINSYKFSIEFEAPRSSIKL